MYRISLDMDCCGYEFLLTLCLTLNVLLHFSCLALYHGLGLTFEVMEGQLWLCYCLLDRVVENFVLKPSLSENMDFSKTFLLRNVLFL